MRCSALRVGVGGRVEAGTGDSVRMRSCWTQVWNLNAKHNPSRAAQPSRPFGTRPSAPATRGILPAFLVPTRLPPQRPPRTQVLLLW